MPDSHDVVLRGAQIYDGTGAPPMHGDLAIDGDRIAAVGSVSGTGRSELDAETLALAPGFIDVHTHDDFAAILHPDMAFKLLGGVTTCVVGNCGMGAAPHAAASAMARAFHPNGRLPEWRGYAGYLELLDANPPSVNIGALIGHGTARLSVMGNEARDPDANELEQLKAIVAEGLEAGALGFSTGLVYEPSRHAGTDEIVELASAMADSGGLYATHMRDEGRHLVRSVSEAIEIGERARVPVQISHHKAAGRDSWGKVAESLRLIEAAQARGLDVHADQYPYTAGSTILAAVVQNWPEDDSADSGLGKVEPKDVVIASTKTHSEWEGRSLADFVSEFGVSAKQAAARILAEEPLATVVMHTMCEDDVQTVMRHPSTMIGSDGIPSLEGRPHPRLYGTFARVLGRYSRELGLFSLEQAVWRMTGFPSRKFGLRDRGVLRVGALADMVLFDPATVIDVGSYEDPKHPPAGIAHVFVNGRHAVREGRHTGERAGRALRRDPDPWG